MSFIYSFLHFSSLFLFLAWGGQRLEVGSQFPDQGWNMGLRGKKCRVWTCRHPTPIPGNSLLDVFFLENQQLLPFHPISQEEQQKWKTLLACYYMLGSVFGPTTINTHQSREKKVCPRQNPRDGAPAGERRNLMRWTLDKRVIGQWEALSCGYKQQKGGCFWEKETPRWGSCPSRLFSEDKMLPKLSLRLPWR